MSRYMIDKLLVAVDRSDSSVEAFKADPVGFVARWLEQEPAPPWPEGGTLTDEERRAFEAVDYATLYSLGAHPYLLWHFVRAVLVPERLSIDQLVEEYRRAVSPLGHPDVAT